VEGQVPVFKPPSCRKAQLYTQALGSLFVASYDLHGYGRGIRSGLHTGVDEVCCSCKQLFIYQFLPHRKHRTFLAKKQSV
jgi:hypothetical protein